MGPVGEALEREHHEIDAALEAWEAAGEGEQEAASRAMLRAMAALRRHIYIEEEFLFPELADKLAIPTLVMLREHGEIWRTMDELERQVAAGEAADESCRILMAQLTMHNGKEEPIFYSQTSDLPSEASSEMMAFLESGAMPDGWVCKQAVVPDQP